MLNATTRQRERASEESVAALLQLAKNQLQWRQDVAFFIHASSLSADEEKRSQIFKKSHISNLFDFSVNEKSFLSFTFHVI